MKIYVTDNAEDDGIRVMDATEHRVVKGEYWVDWGGEPFAHYDVGETCELTLARAREVVRERVQLRRNELSNEVLELDAWLWDKRNPKVVKK